MQKNTESLGSIFDAQPSQITGNIHSLSRPNEQVIGYVSAGTVTQQRIYIARFQVLSNYIFQCPLKDTILPKDTDLRKNFGFQFVPVTPYSVGPNVVGYYSNYMSCIDCRAGGGRIKNPTIGRRTKRYNHQIPSQHAIQPTTSLANLQDPFSGDVALHLPRPGTRPGAASSAGSPWTDTRAITCRKSCSCIRTRIPI